MMMMVMMMMMMMMFFLAGYLISMRKNMPARQQCRFQMESYQLANKARRHGEIRNLIVINGLVPENLHQKSYGGFLKQGYPQIIHFQMVFSLINHPFWGAPISGNPHICSFLQLFTSTNSGTDLRIERHIRIVLLVLLLEPPAKSVNFNWAKVRQVINPPLNHHVYIIPNWAQWGLTVDNLR